MAAGLGEVAAQQPCTPMSRDVVSLHSSGSGLPPDRDRLVAISQDAPFIHARCDCPALRLATLLAGLSTAGVHQNYMELMCCDQGLSACQHTQAVLAGFVQSSALHSLASKHLLKTSQDKITPASSQPSRPIVQPWLVCHGIISSHCLELRIHTPKQPAEPGIHAQLLADGPLHRFVAIRPQGIAAFVPQSPL